MALSADVNLPRTHAAVFPDRCVDCGVPDPGCTVRVGTNAIGWWTIVFWHPGGRFSVDVPACEICRARMIRNRWIRRCVCVIFVIIGVGVAASLLGPLRGPIKRWAAMGIALACMLPWFAWEIVFPPPFDLTAYSDTVDYEFRDQEYAAEFTDINT
jgi:hypothetical protein